MLLLHAYWRAAFVSSFLALPAAARPFQVPAELLERERLSGDWQGERTRLERLGLELELTVIEDLWAVLAGGRRRHASELTFVDAAARFDLERLSGRPGEELYLRLGLRRGSGGVTEDVGAAQGLDNLEGDSGLFVTELWYGFESEGGLVRGHLGKVDAQRVLARLESSGEILHDAAGFDSTLLPFFPDTALGAVLEHALGAGWSLGLGFFDAVDGGFEDVSKVLSASFEEQVVAIELVYDWSARGDTELGRAGLGVWHHTGDFATFDGGVSRGEEGVYLFGEQQLWRGSGPDGEAPAMSVYGQLAWGHEEALPISRHLGVGARLARHVPERPLDVSGAYATYAKLSDAPGSPFGDRELTLEVFHRFQLLPALAVQPVTQWILDPGGSRDEALVLGLRLELAL